MVSYLIDELGNTTHAVVPIEEWKIIQENMQKAEETRILSYPAYHINSVVAFIKEHNHLDTAEWLVAYNDFYSYYKKLDMKDIMALQLFRAGILTRASIKNNIAVYEDLFNQRPIKFLLEKDGSSLTKKSLNILKEAISNKSEFHFLDIFNKTVSFSPDLIADYKTNYQRLRRSAERDRMFIYDLTVFYAIKMFGSDKEFQRIFTEDENIIIGDFIGLIYNYIAEHLYKGNISQVYRAAKEGSNRINKMLI